MRRAKPDPTDARIKSIAKTVRSLDAIFTCGGAIELEAPVELTFKSGKAIRVVRDGTWAQRDVGKKLMKQCQPAGFGVGRETRRDPRVREGGQVLAQDGGLTVRGLDLAAAGVLAEVQRELCAGDARPPEAELYALNVYDRRGHFVTHKDTPRDPDVFGTLVACLPIPFTGGRLVLRHETTRSYAWETRSLHSRTGEPYRVHWAAFYGDVDHQIEPVTEGTRVTLTWNLRRSASAKKNSDPQSDARALESALRTAVADRRFAPDGVTLGVPCLHLYPELPHLSSRTASELKGRDRTIADAAERVGLVPRYRPYLFETCANESWRLERYPTPREASIFDDYQLGASKLERTLPIESHTDWDSGDDVTWVLPPPWLRASRREAEPATKLLGELEYSATDYFGNEGAYCGFYVAAVLLVDVPPAKERASAAKSPMRRPPSKGR